MTDRPIQRVKELLRSGQPRGDMSPAEKRAAMEAGCTKVPLAPDVRCEPANANGVPVEFVSTPESEENRVICFLHGGGYMTGSIVTHREEASRLARASKGRVLLIDYRLAPENRFPAAVDDSVTVYRWLVSQGIRPENTVVAGDSAGGGLTLATALVLRDAGEVLPAAIITISPWVDLECRGGSYDTRSGLDPLLTRDNLLECAKSYLGDADPRNPLASPIHADLKGLPPLLIQAGTDEVLYDDAVQLARKADAARAEVALEVWQDMVHTWHSFAAILPEGQRAIDSFGKFAQKRTG